MQLRHDDRGVTLPEVLVAVAILAIIIVPLSDALIGFIRNTDDTTRRMNESHDMQIAATYFARDIQSLGVRDWSSPTFALRQSIDNPSYPCTGPGTPRISLAWDDPTSVSGTTDIRVTYLVRDVGGEHQLRRLQCFPHSTTVESDVVVVHNLIGTPPLPACASATGVSVPCNGAGVNVPQNVTLTVTVKHPASAGPAILLVLIGQRRQS